MTGTMVMYPDWMPQRVRWTRWIFQNGLEADLVTDVNPQLPRRSLQGYRTLVSRDLYPIALYSDYTPKNACQFAVFNHLVNKLSRSLCRF
ncbi:hypothetical protein ACFL9T_06215 [Thermodesulfobacteriota bacterium]